MFKFYIFFCLSLATPALAAPTEVDKVVARPDIEVRLGSGLTPLIEKGFKVRVESIRKHLATELGLLLPGVRFTPDLALAANEYRILAQGTQWAQGMAMPNQVMILGSESQLATFPGTPTKDPAYGMPGKWVDMAHKSKAEEMGCMAFDAVSIWATDLTELGRVHARQLYNGDHLKASMAVLREAQPALVSRLDDEPAYRQKLLGVLGNLLDEQVPVRDLETVAELVMASPSSSVDSLTEAARVRLAGSILKELVVDQEVSTSLVGPKLDAAIAGLGQGLGIGDSPVVQAQILPAISKEVQRLKEVRIQPVLVTSAAARPILRRLTHKEYPRMVILSRDELLPYYAYKTVGTVEIP